MKRLKAICSFLAISLGVTAMPVNAAVVSVPLINNAWTYIGVPGFQNFGASSASSGVVWAETGDYTIIDGAGTLGSTDYTVAGLEVPTWDGNVSNAVTSGTLAAIDDSDAAYSNNTPRATNNGAGVGSNIYGTVGLMVIGQSDSTTDVHSTDDTHAGARMAAMRLTTRVYKSITSSIRTMYIQSPDASQPDIKVLYQANQEGNTFKIQYQIGTATNTLDWENNTVYTGTFNRSYTYDNAAMLGDDFPVAVVDPGAAIAGNQVRNILHAFDMDLTNNELNGSKNLIEPNQDNALNWTDYGDAFVSDATYDLREALDGNLTMLWFDTVTQQWRQIRATNYQSTGSHTGNPVIELATDIPTTTSGLNKGDLEKGRGYWVKLEPNAASTGVSGFVLGSDGSSIDHTNYVGDGWNMLSFEDEYLSYSVTGMVFTDDSDFNLTDTYGASTLALGDVNGSTAAGAAASCLAINAAIDTNNNTGYTNLNIKCIADLNTPAVVLLSTRRFSASVTVGTTAPTSLAGTTLTAESDGTYDAIYKTVYGEFAMIVEPNLTFLTDVNDGNMSIEFPVNSGDVGAVYARLATNADGSVAAVTTAMGSGTTGLTLPQNNVVALDMDFDGAANDALLLASNYRFFIKDATQVRVFTYDNTVYDSNITYGLSNVNYTAPIRIKGKADYTATMSDDNLSATVASIETGSATTGVNATILNDTNTTLMLYYSGLLDVTRAGTIDLQEWATGYDVFREVYAESYAETNASAKGAVARIWQISTIAEAAKDANASNEFDGNYSTILPASGLSAGDIGDLRFNAYYAQNFPVSGPLFELKTDLGVKAESIITGQTFTDGSYISWKQIDVSKPTDTWYDTDDQYELFWTEKEKGYWVYINGTTTNDLSIATPDITGDTYAHFNNRYSGAATSALTRNHLNKTLSVNISGLTSGGANANTDAYEVYGTVGGVVTSFQRTGTGNDFVILLNSHETNGIDFDAGEMEITITAAEGSGKKVTTTYILDYSKPDITNVAIDGTNVTVSVTNADAEEFHVYTGDINDSSYGGLGTTNWGGKFYLTGEDTVLNLGTISSLAFATAFENNSSAYLDVSTALNTLAEQITEGIVRDVRIVAKDTKDTLYYDGLYSDQQRLYYIPWKSGTGVLSDSSALGDSTYDSGPVVYNADGTTDATYDGTVNDGVQLSANSGTITCVYPHEDVDYTEGTGEARTLVTTDGAVIGSVIYSADLAGNPLICQTATGTFVGGFPAAGEAAPATNTLTMVPLSSRVSVTLVK
jgi:hypothetical protein